MSNNNVILLTGGSSGIGLFAVKELVKTSPGATIVVASRTPPPNSFPGVHFRALDLCSDSSVRAFVKSYDCGPISSLVLNAGLFPSKGPTYTAPDTQSRRHETALAASHIGHALLLYLLAADKVLQPRCRLIFVTSALHDPRAPGAPAAPYWTSPEAADSATDKRLASGAVRYANAKLAVVLFANALARKTKESKQWEILIFEPGFSPGGGSKLDRGKS
ncbi:uncharacterized protein L199_002876 [Kwoniella botswanensis]|uniref:uncharacterized protein n=1 Tax=Kwoniella botswanensis TaxID=1268659 RepID=UPI00315CC6BD